ncbi:hypothetical protein C2G38_18507 [Gigaspora rosea]|uniref:BTB domain-containing protein n=1 Tax=Gigaspora rosea TaxID=44941 RepID=A0A397UQQ1_9GLOM|nr:hypothetical protein C2G38_18507 [Gigaspora rosea]
MKLFFKKLSDDLTDLLRNEEDYNVLIEIGEASNCQLFKVHSVILNSRCSYFRNELSKINFDEKNIKKINKPHVSADAFKVIIDYIYGGFVRYEKVDASTIFDLLSTANQFGLNELVETSQTQLVKNHKSWIHLNFAKVYKTSLESDNFKVLQQSCNEIIVKQPSVLFDSENFTNISEKALITFLKLEAVHTDEVKIWEQIIRWGIAQNSGLGSNPDGWSDANFLTLKSTLKNCLPYIQYSQITTEDFTNKLCPYQQIFEPNLWKDIETKNKTIASTSQVTSATISSSKNTAITDENKNNDSTTLFQNNSTVTSKEKNEMENENSATSTIMSTTSIATSTTSTTTSATSYGSTSLPENDREYKPL